jgi:hypothetical protein
MASQSSLALRFQRAELQAKANLSPVGLAVLAETTGPQALIDSLATASPQDAASALAFILPHRQTVWWGIMVTRLLPDLAANEQEVAALDAAEAWVQRGRAEDCERAQLALELCADQRAPYWVAMATWWAGPSLGPRGQEPVPPAPFLPGVGIRSAVVYATLHECLAEKMGFAGALSIGREILAGGLGREAQAAVRARIGNSAD